MLLVIAAVAVDASSWTDCFSMAPFWEFWESYVLLQARASAVVLAITVEAAAACIVPSSVLRRRRDRCTGGGAFYSSVSQFLLGSGRTVQPIKITHHCEPVPPATL